MAGFSAPQFLEPVLEAAHVELGYPYRHVVLTRQPHGHGVVAARRPGEARRVPRHRVLVVDIVQSTPRPRTDRL